MASAVGRKDVTLRKPRRQSLAFGEYDVVLIVETPGNVQAVAIAMAVVAGGGVSKCKTTPLMTRKEGVEAMQAAGGSGYQPPSS